MLEIVPGLIIPASELEITFARSSGPGGQHVNKTESQVVLRWNVASTLSIPGGMRERFLNKFASRITVGGEIVLQCGIHRHQGRNREEVLERLRDMILQVLRPPKPRRKTRPTRTSVEKRIKSKKVRGQTKAARRYRD